LEEKREKRDLVEQFALPKFPEVLHQHDLSLDRVPATVFQLNIGLYCNQACSHCHVDSSPKRKQMMTQEVANQCLKIIKNSPSIKTVDLTGGAPELNQQFRYLVQQARALGLEVIDRCNLTVLLEPKQEDLADFLVANKVRVVASLPCYLEKNVTSQRGEEVFERSIAGLKKLNKLGYGSDPSLVLDLVYNPVGAHLPPPQAKLQADYKKVLKDQYEIVFNSLFCITNQPINRYLDHLVKIGKLEEYMQLLVNKFNPSSVQGVMCKSYVSVQYDGQLFDCDFNQQIDLPTKNPVTKNKPLTVFDIKSVEDLLPISITTRSHCFACTAGAGSSCQGEVKQ